MSNSVQLHKRQPTRLPRPWDSPGKNTGVGCHVLLQCMKLKSESEVAQSCLILQEPMDCNLSGSSIHGIFQARVLEWTAIAFSRGFFQPRDWTWVSCIVGRCFTVWATFKCVGESRLACVFLHCDICCIVFWNWTWCILEVCLSSFQSTFLANYLSSQCLSVLLVCPFILVKLTFWLFFDQSSGLCFSEVPSFHFVPSILSILKV